MRIGCLQFAPQVGDVDNNLNRADSVLSKANPDDLDLLVLPELAFTGYNFKSLQDITPFLEPSGSGITSLWARTIALKYNCIVTVGYPEKVDVSPKWPTGPEYYNSAIVVNGDGETIANYRKSFLYYTDETWALEGNRGFYEGFIPGLGNTSIGICMDLNPYKFEAPWHAFEFAMHVLEMESNLVIVSMAWMTREERRRFSRMPNEPDMETLTYWVTRLEPLIRSENKEEILVVFCNRTGIEDEATYAGTSAVVGIQDGEVNVYGLLGRGEKELLVVDTNDAPYAKLVYRPESGGFDRQPVSPGKSKPSTSHEATFAQPNSDKSTEQKSDQTRDVDRNPPTEKTSTISSSSKARSSEAKEMKHLTDASSSTSNSSRGRSPIKKTSPLPPSSAPVLPAPAFESTKEVVKKRPVPSEIKTSDLQGVGSFISTKSPGQDNFNIPTPSAPSPTPMAVRPRLIIPDSPSSILHQYSMDNPMSAASEQSERSVQSVKSNESEASTQTIRSNPRPPEDSTPYPHSGMPLSGYPANSFHSGKRIYGGHVTISQADVGFSPITPFEDFSPASPRWFWRPPEQSLKTPLSGSDWVSGTPIGRKPEPFPWPAIRPSSRSQSKTRVRDRTGNESVSQDVRQMNSQSPQSNTSSNRTRRSNSTTGTTKPSYTRESYSERPPSPKSRNASRSRTHEQPNTPFSHQGGPTTVAKHLEEISQRAASVNRLRDSATVTPSPDRPRSPKSRNCSRSRPSETEPRRDGQTIPIAASPSLLETESRPSSTSQTPVMREEHRPMSRIGYHKRSHSFTNASRNNPIAADEKSSTSGKGSMPQRPASRAASRGRQPWLTTSLSEKETKSLPDERASSADSTCNAVLHSRIHGSGLNELERKEVMKSSADNVSQLERSSSQQKKSGDFERVEAILCPNCPVHGGRPTSSAEGNRESQSAVSRQIGEAPFNNTNDNQSRSSGGSPKTLDGNTAHSVENGNVDDARKLSTDYVYVKAEGFPVLAREVKDISSMRGTSQAVFGYETSPLVPPRFDPPTPTAMAFDENCVDRESHVTDGRAKEVGSTHRCGENDVVNKTELSTSTVA